MELVLDRVVCTRGLLAQLPAGLTHLHLERCSLELKSLLPVARSLPRLRVLGLDATISTAALIALLKSAPQRGALTVHVWKLYTHGVDADNASQLTEEEVVRISGLAAARMAPQPTPQVVWHVWHRGSDREKYAANARFARSLPLPATASGAEGTQLRASAVGSRSRSLCSRLLGKVVAVLGLGRLFKHR
jgi:hypothetical protein